MHSLCILSGLQANKSLALASGGGDGGLRFPVRQLPCHRGQIFRERGSRELLGANIPGSEEMGALARNRPDHLQTESRLTATGAHGLPFHSGSFLTLDSPPPPKFSVSLPVQLPHSHCQPLENAISPNLLLQLAFLPGFPGNYF